MTRRPWVLAPHETMFRMTDLSSDADRLAGYRVVRKLGEGARADVFLGVADTPVAAERSVAIKVFRASVSEADILNELEALDRAPRSHCAHLIDVSTGTNGLPIAILPKLARGSLGSMLHRRGSVTPGEAVTVLAPLARAVVELHARGIAHTALGASSVHFADDGSPHLLGFGHAALFAAAAPPAALDAHEGVRQDRRALAQLARLVFDSADPSVRELMHWLDTTDAASSATFAEDLEERLFDVCAPLPVDLDRDGALGRRTALSPLSPVVPARVQAGAPGRRSNSLTQQRARGRREAISDRLLGPSPLAAVRERAADSLRAVRARWWVAIALIIVGLVAATLLLPSEGSRSATAPVAVAERRGDNDHPAAAPTAGGASNEAQPAAAELEDDPAGALPVLLAERARCFETASIGCLDSVDQAGSGLLAADSAAIKEQGPGSVDVAGSAVALSSIASPTVTETLGEFTLVQFVVNDKPASALLVRTEAGWRLRVLFGAMSP
jgi:hypothetical protein